GESGKERIGAGGATGLPTGTAGRATGAAASAVGTAATPLGGSGVSPGLMRAWKVFLQNLQRIAWSSHSAGMRRTFWQCGHRAWTTWLMAATSSGGRAQCLQTIL